MKRPKQFFTSTNAESLRAQRCYKTFLVTCMGFWVYDGCSSVCK